MVLVFILLGITVLILCLTFIILLSTFYIEIRNLEATNIKALNKEESLNNKENITEKNNGYAVILSLYLCNKIRWFRIHLNNERLRKMYTKMQLEKIDIKKIEQDFKLEDLKIIKNINPKISYLNLDAELGIESPILTSFIVSILCSIIAIFLPYLVVNFESKNFKYNIKPIYQNKNLYKIKLNCIIQVKMVHIINAIYIFIKKGSKVNERTTSNRRSHGYSYE